MNGNDRRESRNTTGGRGYDEPHAGEPHSSIATKTGRTTATKMAGNRKTLAHISNTRRGQLSQG